MRTITMNKKLTLRQKRTVQGSSDDEELITEAVVMAAISPPSLRLKSSAAAMGYEVSMTAGVWRSEYCNGEYNYAMVDGIEYHIVDEISGITDMVVNLVLERG